MKTRFRMGELYTVERTFTFFIFNKKVIFKFEKHDVPKYNIF